MKKNAECTSLLLHGILAVCVCVRACSYESNPRLLKKEKYVG